jgi:hypothetical protein
MIGVVIPAHNEEKHITDCLTSVVHAAKHPGLRRQLVTLLGLTLKGSALASFGRRRAL